MKAALINVMVRTDAVLECLQEKLALSMRTLAPAEFRLGNVHIPEHWILRSTGEVFDMRSSDALPNDIVSHVVLIELLAPNTLEWDKCLRIINNAFSYFNLPATQWEATMFAKYDLKRQDI